MHWPHRAAYRTKHRCCKAGKQTTEAWLIAGRRAGKSAVLALTATYLAVFKDYTQYLQVGERATIRVMSANRDQARVIFRYISAFLSEGWWMRQHLGGRYGPEFNVARNWMNAGRPLDGPRPGALGVKAHHVFEVIRVVDHDHVLAISGNDHNEVRTRIRPTSDVIGWRDVTEKSTAADKPAADPATAEKAAASGMGSDKSADDATAQGP
jgi:hypothetical protein